MIYFIYGDQTPLIKQRCKKIVNEVLGESKDDMNYVKFDAQDTLIQDIISECGYLPLGYDKKVVVVENAYFLLSEKPKVRIESDQNYKVMINYINHPNDFTDLVVTVPFMGINKESEIVNLLLDKANVMVASNPDEDKWKAYVKKYINSSLGVEIDNDAVNELASRCKGDIYLFQNHAKKLALYTNHIHYDDVCLFVPRPLDDNIYHLYNFLISGRNDEAIILFRDLVAQGYEPVNLASTLARQFRFLSQVAYLNKKSYSNDDMATMLKCKPGRINITKKDVYKLSESTIYKALDDLYKLDLNIKSGAVDRFFAFELFLANFKVS